MIALSPLTSLVFMILSLLFGLFTSEPMDVAAHESLLSNICSTLTPEQASSCDGLLYVGECCSALLGMAKGKAPGSDGLPMEFYVKFWDVLGQDLVYVFNSCYRGFLSLSA